MWKPLGQTLSVSNKWRELSQELLYQPPSQRHYFSIKYENPGYPFPSLSSKLHDKVPDYRSTSDGLHQPVDLLGSNQGSRAPWALSWFWILGHGMASAVSKEIWLSQASAGCSIKYLRFQVGTSCTEGKRLGKFSHLASFHVEDG